MNATATPERTKLDHLRQKEAELAGEVDAVRQRLAGYPAAIAAEREQSFFTKPSKRPLAQLNSKLQKLLDADKTDSSALVHLEGDLAAIRSVLAVETQRQAEEELVEVRAQDERERARQADLVRQGGELLAELVTIYNVLVAAAEEHDRSRSEATAKLPPDLAAYLDTEGQALLLSPMPVTFSAFTRMLTDASLDLDGRGFREGPQVVEHVWTTVRRWWS